MKRTKRIPGPSKVPNVSMECTLPVDFIILPLISWKITADGSWPSTGLSIISSRPALHGHVEGTIHDIQLLLACQLNKVDRIARYANG
jgi:hypothetical protein